MITLPYHLVDVFTTVPFGGNQLAVFPDAEGLSAPLMQRIARELNLSESAFVLPSTTADFRVRFFTPMMELPLAGHPTIGTAFVLGQANRLPPGAHFSFEEGVGLVPMTRDGDGFYMQQPIPQFGPVLADRAAVAAMLSLAPADLLEAFPVQVVSSGVPFTYVPVASLEAIRRVQFRRDVWSSVLEHTEGPQVFAFTPETAEPGHTVHARMFAPTMGISEDPATGAACGPLGAYLLKHGLVQGDPAVAMVCEQGYEIGRPSQIRIRVEHDGAALSKVLVGGTAVAMGSGQLVVPE